MADITKILLRRDSEINWKEVNPVLGLGEPAVGIDNNGNIIGFKIGDGHSHWNELVYLSGDFSAIAERVSNLEIEFRTLNEEINGNLQHQGLKQLVQAIEAEVDNPETGIEALNRTVTAQGQQIELNTNNITIKENSSNKVKALSNESTDDEYPSAKCVYDVTERLQDLIGAETLARATAIKSINDLIPEQASAENKLADKNFVNSSIATNTANFIGTFEDIASLLAYAGTITNNDYAFVINSVIKNNGNDFVDYAELEAYDKTNLTNFDYAWVINGANFDLYRYDIILEQWDLKLANTQKNQVTLNTAYNRYKYNGESWIYEYTLNNSSFTASQWAAINSGITAELASSITGKQEQLTAGNNISIYRDMMTDQLMISATDTNTTYSAGTGIDLNGTQFSLNGLIPYTTTAPTSNNPTPGVIKIVVLDYEPNTRYNGYWYIITEPLM